MSTSLTLFFKPNISLSKPVALVWAFVTSAVVVALSTASFAAAFWASFKFSNLSIAAWASAFALDKFVVPSNAVFASSTAFFAAATSSLVALFPALSKIDCAFDTASSYAFLASSLAFV